MSDAVVLLSGGLDSAVTLALAVKQGKKCHALTVNYGQRHAVELDAAGRVADSIGVAGHSIVIVNLRTFGGSALTDDIEVPKDTAPSNEIPITYVPARNTVFLSFALAHAESLGASEIFIGVNAVDYSGYPDCRPEFISAFENLARVATKMGVEGAQITISAPLLTLSKREIVLLGQELRVDFSLTHSCYDPDQQGRACGHCDSCLLRATGFREAELDDPALAHLKYAS